MCEKQGIDEDAFGRIGVTVIGLGCVIGLLTATLVWEHYFLLALPAWAAVRHRPRLLRWGGTLFVVGLASNDLRSLGLLDTRGRRELGVDARRAQPERRVHRVVVGVDQVVRRAGVVRVGGEHLLGDRALADRLLGVRDDLARILQLVQCRLQANDHVI